MGLCRDMTETLPPHWATSESANNHGGTATAVERWDANPRSMTDTTEDTWPMDPESRDMDLAEQAPSTGVNDSFSPSDKSERGRNTHLVKFDVNDGYHVDQTSDSPSQQSRKGSFARTPSIILSTENESKIIFESVEFLVSDGECPSSNFSQSSSDEKTDEGKATEDATQNQEEDASKSNVCDGEGTAESPSGSPRAAEGPAEGPAMGNRVRKRNGHRPTSLAAQSSDAASEVGSSSLEKRLSDQTRADEAAADASVVTNGEVHQAEAQEADAGGDSDTAAKDSTNGRSKTTDNSPSISGNEEAIGVREKLQKLFSDLPDGVRPLPPHILPPGMLPPGGKPLLIPEGKTITKEMVRRCLEIGIFPVPPPGKTMNSIVSDIDENDDAREKKSEEKEGSTDGVDDNFQEQPKTRIEISDEEFKRQSAMYMNQEPHKTVLKFYVATWIIRCLVGLLLCFRTTRLAVCTLVILVRADVYPWTRFLLSWLLVEAIALKVLRNVRTGPRCPQEVLDRSRKDPAWKRKVAIVTGGTSGVGLELVKELIRCQCGKIILGVLDEMRALQALERAKHELVLEGHEYGRLGLMVEVLELDVSDLKSVKKFTHELANRQLRVDLVIMNAGSLWLPQKKIGNLEAHFVNNFLGHFLLARQLFFVVNQVGGKVISTSSCTYLSAKSLDVEDVLKNADDPDIPPMVLYGTSKGCQILFTRVLAERFEGARTKVHATATCWHPGIVATNITRHIVNINPPLMKILQWFMQPVFRTAEEGAQTGVYLIHEDNEKLVNGAYYADCTVKPTYLACDFNRKEVNMAAQKLWAVANQIVHPFSFSVDPPKGAS